MTPRRHFVEQSSDFFSVVSALADGVVEDDELGLATRHPRHYLSAKHCGLRTSSALAAPLIQNAALVGNFCVA
jgi:hypothetical protein